MPRLNKTGWKKMLGDTKASTGDAHLVSRPPGDDPDQMEMFAPPASQAASTATLPPADKSPSIRREDLTPLLLVVSLRSAICPACGHPKNATETLCSRDYFRLPPGLRKALYRRIGSGYEESLLKALKFLKARVFHTVKGGLSK